METVQSAYRFTISHEGSDRPGIAGTAEQIADHAELVAFLVRDAGAVERVCRGTKVLQNDEMR